MSLQCCNARYFHFYKLFGLMRKVHRSEGFRLLSSAQPTSSKAKKSKGGGKYSDSLNLPQMPYALSEFKPDGRCNERERYIHNVADFEGLYEWQQKNNSGPTFAIHDGPPYANGSPHVGHALNKIIKDVINRYKVMRGHKVNFIPGWDCHGLPIELKARDGSDSQLSNIEVRKQAHHFSRQTLDIQRQEFKDWGVMADWTNPYITSDASYVQNELDIFQKLYDKGLIYEDYMPVYWSPSSKTALAEAELEYNADHCSQSIYVKLPLTSIPDELKAVTSPSTSMDIVIWTTTAWTLPANKAVCFSPNIQYSLVKYSDQYCIVAKDLLQQIFDKLNIKYEVISTFSGLLLSGHTYCHPIYGDRQCPLLAADHVTCDVGTGFVHTAPAHGHDDFKVALKHGLDRECMVDEQGFYTSVAGEQFAGRHIFEQGNDIVREMLGSYLLYTEQYTHKYPYDWRTKQPVFIRASRQWFIDTNSLREPALKALEGVAVSPGVYKAPMCETISQRPYWCISRQRAWGVPIPAFTDQHGNTHVHRVLTDHLRQLVTERGIDVWWEADDATVLPDSVKKEAGIAADLTLRRNLDILDIWFDSGVTWSAVLGTTPADIYIEGVDQIRGWFQSSLLTSVALNGTAPYKSIMMHGFTVDEDGQKMSKSAGNVVAPSDVIHGNKADKPGYGVDVLRWWAASKYSSTNVDIGPNMIRQCNDKMLQMRKRMRFILGNVYDFIPDTHQLDYQQLLPQDQHFLHILYEYGTKVSACYERRELSAVLKWLELFMAKFSNQYATSCKDRLYCFPADGVERRSAQTVLHHTFTFIVHSAAPILPFFAEHCYTHRYGNQLNKSVNTEGSKATSSVFRNGWFEMDQRWDNSKLAEKFNLIYRMLEELRAAVGSKPLETLDMVIECDNDVYATLQELQEDADIGELSSHSPLCETVQCASVAVCTSEERNQFELISTCDACHTFEDLKLKVYVKESSCVRCERCRRFTATTSAEPCQTCLLNMAGSWAA